MNVLGIDLGTTNSCVAKSDDNGVIETITISNTSDPTVPSVVYFDDNSDGKPIVGQGAKNRLKSKGKDSSSIDIVKREMGKAFCDKELTIMGQNRKVSPVEISACILNHLFKGANDVLVNRDRVPAAQKAVISIPAAFNNIQRMQTKRAAELAGIEVLDLVHEPTAAAIAYKIKGGETILVFDLGGGTLDVSIVKNNFGKYEVLGSDGDVKLGGKDWDEALAKHALRKIGVDSDYIDKHGYVWAGMMEEAEKQKKQLSIEESTTFNIAIPQRSIFDSVDISRAEFENITSNLCHRCMEIVRKAINDAKNPTIDRFVMVGGSSRMPMIRKRLISEFHATYSHGRISDDVFVVSDPDMAIAKGAAKYASLILRGDISPTEINDLIEIKDKCQYSYGTEVEIEGKLQIRNMIFRSEPLVVPMKTFTFKTSVPNQSSAPFGIYENTSDEDYIPLNDEKPVIKESIKIPLGHPKGTKIECQISRDSSGIIDLKAFCMGEKLSMKYGTATHSSGEGIDFFTDEIINNTRESIRKMNSSNS